MRNLASQFTVTDALDYATSEVLKKPNLKFVFNTNELPDHKNFSLDIFAQPRFDTLYKQLSIIKDHCIYWFSCASVEDAAILNSHLDKHRMMLKASQRVVPVVNDSVGSSTIYVGKRFGGVRKRDQFTNVAGRMVIHFGYYKEGSTQGLQLAHWARDLDIELTISISELSGFPRKYVDAMEKLVAHKLNPLCGRH